MKDNFKIWCKTNEQRDAVLKKLEQMEIKWAEGQKASEWDLVSDAPVGIVVKGKKISESKSRFGFEIILCDTEEIKVEDFIKVNECIVIYRKDDKVIALDKRTGNKGIARCNPEDEFNFETGAKLAFERLLPPAEPTYYNGKVVCIANTDGKYTTKFVKVGEIFEFKNGVSQYKDGTSFPGTRDPYKSLEELNKSHCGKFVEVIE